MNLASFLFRFKHGKSLTLLERDKAIARLAEQLTIPRSAVIRIAVVEYLRKKPKG